MPKFRASKGAIFDDKTAQEYGDFLMQYTVDDMGVSPDYLLDLGPEVLPFKLEWNDTVAARNYRKQQIRNIVNHIEIETTTDSGEVRWTVAFHSISLKIASSPKEEVKIDMEIATEERGYFSYESVKKSKPRYNAVKAYIKSNLKHWRDRYADWNEFEPVWEAIDALED